MGGMIGKFSDDTEIGRVVDSEERSCRLQDDINGLVEWAEKWQMEFNPEKCEVMHLGRADEAREFSINGKILRGVEEVRPWRACPQVPEGDGTGG